MIVRENWPSLLGALTPEAQRVFDQLGLEIDCRPDPTFHVGPAGGEPAVLCEVDGSGYIHGEQAINAMNPLTLYQGMYERYVRRQPPIPTAAPAPPPTPAFLREPAPAPPSARAAEPARNGPQPTPAPTPSVSVSAPPLPGPSEEPALPGGPEQPALDGRYEMAREIFTDEWISGVPNWLVFAAAGGALMFMGARQTA